MTNRLRRRLHLLVALAHSDLRIRYGRGTWQIANWFVHPFALVGVYLLLRTVLARGGSTAALTVACAVVPFQIVTLSIESSLSAVSLREPVLLNRAFDRMLLPPATVLTETVAFGASFLLFPITMAMAGVAPTWSILWLPLVIAITIVFALGVAWPSVLIGTWFPHIKVVVGQVARFLFFAAPGVVALDEVTGDIRRWMLVNPLTGLFEGFRSILIDGERPRLDLLAVSAGFGVALMLIFVPLYRREQRHFAKLVRS